MNNLERSALLWLRVFTLNPTRKISSEMVELYGVSRRRSREIITYLKGERAILLKTSIGFGSRWVIDRERAQELLQGLELDGSREKKAGW